MNLRILLASDHYPPFIGGAHRQTQLLGAEMQKRGHTVNVATVWQPGMAEIENDNDVVVHRLKDMRTALSCAFGKATADGKQRHHPAYPDPVTIRGLNKVIDNFQPDIIHSYGWFTYSLAVALQDKSIPLLISARDYAYGCATRTLVHNGESACSGPALSKCFHCANQLYGAPKGMMAVLGSDVGDRLLKGKVTGIHSISTYVQEMVHRDFLKGEVTDLPEAIIPSFRESLNSEEYSADPALHTYVERLPKEPYILFVGALRRVKGVHHLLEAYQQLRQAPPLVLIGTCESDTPKGFPANVHILENFPHRAVMAAWERACFGVIPSLWAEPLGSVVYEGMSQGKAVIGTKPGGHTDMIVDGESGLLVGQGDVAALTNAMQILIDKPDYCARLGEAARQRATRFIADVSVPKFEQLYHRVVQQAKATQQSPLPATAG